MPQEHIAVLPPKPTIAILCLILSCIILATFAYQDEAAWKDALTQFLENARGTPWALPIVCLCYLLCPLILFPIILLNLACAMVFGLWGIVYALIGGLLNAAVYFGIGHYVRRRRGGAGWLAHPRIAPVDKNLRKAGLAGIILIHSLPAPPYAVTNFIAGLSSVNFPTFFAGTFLALLPGAIARGIVGDSLMKIILHPQPENYAYLALGLALWLLMLGGMHALLKRYAPDKGSAGS